MAADILLGRIVLLSQSASIFILKPFLMFPFLASYVEGSCIDDQNTKWLQVSACLDCETPGCVDLKGWFKTPFDQCMSWHGACLCQRRCLRFMPCDFFCSCTSSASVYPVSWCYLCPLKSGGWSFDLQRTPFVNFNVI